MNIVSCIDDVGKMIESYLVSQRKTIQKLLLVLSFLSLFLVFFPSTINDTGDIALWLLWILLWIPIFARVFSLGIAKKCMIFRKELGILMGAMAFVHSAQYFFEQDAYMPWQGVFWVQEGLITYLALGMIALIITIFLTITSNIWSIKKLGKHWKLFHRSVYIVLIFTLLHVAFIHILRSPNVWYTSVVGLVPFFVYFAFKILEWKHVKINIFSKKFLLVFCLGAASFWGFQTWGDAYISEQFDAEKTVSVQDIFQETPQLPESFSEGNIEPKQEIEPEENSQDETPDFFQEPEVGVEPEVVEEQITVETQEVFETNISSIVQLCDTLCGSDSATYCTAENEVVFGQEQITYATCRTLAKYNRTFHRCESFCEGYGKNKGPNSYCTLSDGAIDRNCDGL